MKLAFVTDPAKVGGISEIFRDKPAVRSQGDLQNGVTSLPSFHSAARTDDAGNQHGEIMI
jgi:hypothetical protein